MVVANWAAVELIVVGNVLSLKRRDKIVPISDSRSNHVVKDSGGQYVCTVYWRGI